MTATSDVSKERSISLGAAHVDPRDAYRDVPILKQPVWGHLVAAYFYLGGLSAGAAMIGSLAELFRGERHGRLSRAAHYISFATFLPCPPLLIFDLGMPQRFHHMLRIVKPSSPMNLGAWAFAVHGAGATFTVGRMLAAEGRLPIIGFFYRLLPERLLVALGIPSSFGLAGYTGVLLGTTSVPVWNTSQLLGGLFMASAFSTGAAAISLVGSVTGREDEEERHALSALGAAAGATEASLLAGYLVTTGRAAGPLYHGQAGKLLAGAATSIAASAALDLIGALARGNRRRRLFNGLGSFAALVAGAFLRWAVVYAGRASAADREGTLHAMRPRKRVPGWGPKALAPTDGAQEPS